jgi:hypothetical protein
MQPDRGAALPAHRATDRCGADARRDNAGLPARAAAASRAGLQTRLATSIALAAALAVVTTAQQSAPAPQGVGQTPSPLPLSHTLREHGSSVTGAYEGWYKDADGAVRLLVGYFNRNTKQELDIPVGPDNRIEPGGPDQGQPTHFLTGRQWGVFTIKVPADFGDRKLTWTIVANGQTNVITLHTKAEWVVEPFEDVASRNTPPVLKFEPSGATFTGPPIAIAASYTVTTPEAVTLSAWVTDEGPKINLVPPTTQTGSRRAGTPPPTGPPPLAVSWSKFRGPGSVAFENTKPSIDKEHGGKTTTTATFTEAGEYILRLQANDTTGEGGGGFQCCWTNAHVRVTVKGSSSREPALRSPHDRNNADRRRRP